MWHIRRMFSYCPSEVESSRRKRHGLTVSMRMIIHEHVIDTGPAVTHTLKKSLNISPMYCVNMIFHSFWALF